MHHPTIGLGLDSKNKYIYMYNYIRLYLSVVTSLSQYNLQLRWLGGDHSQLPSEHPHNSACIAAPLLRQLAKANRRSAMAHHESLRQFRRWEHPVGAHLEELQQDVSNQHEVGSLNQTRHTKDIETRKDKDRHTTQNANSRKDKHEMQHTYKQEKTNTRRTRNKYNKMLVSPHLFASPIQL